MLSRRMGRSHASCGGGASTLKVLKQLRMGPKTVLRNNDTRPAKYLKVLVSKSWSNWILIVPVANNFLKLLQFFQQHKMRRPTF